MGTDMIERGVVQGMIAPAWFPLQQPTTADKAGPPQYQPCRPSGDARRDARDEIDRSGLNCGRAMYCSLSDAQVSGAAVSTVYWEIAPAAGSLREMLRPSCSHRCSKPPGDCCRWAGGRSSAGL